MEDFRRKTLNYVQMVFEYHPPDPIFLMMGVPMVVLQCAKGPVLTIPSPLPKKSSENMTE